MKLVTGSSGESVRLRLRLRVEIVTNVGETGKRDQNAQGASLARISLTIV
jgi:hypothetical protein